MSGRNAVEALPGSQLEDALAHPDGALLIIDAGARPIAQKVLGDRWDKVGHVIEWEPTEPHLSIDSVRSLAASLWDEPAERVVVAIGGGQTLDAAKLATAEPGLLSLISAKGKRAGLVQAPRFRRHRRLVLVPSTIGTGSEASSSAVVSFAHGHVLVTGHSLLPDAFVIDERLLRTLPERMIADGAREVLLRAIGPAIGDPAIRPTADMAEVVEACLAALQGSDTLALSNLAHASACSHGLHRARASTPYPMRHWYVANELSFLTGAPKMTVTRAVVPRVWARIEAGVDAWGDPAALEEVWRFVRELAPRPLAPRASSGISELMSPDDDRPWRDLESERIVLRCLSRWGDRLPMLAGIDAEEIRATLGTHETGRAS